MYNKSHSYTEDCFDIEGTSAVRNVKYPNRPNHVLLIAILALGYHSKDRSFGSHHLFSPFLLWIYTHGQATACKGQYSCLYCIEYALTRLLLAIVNIMRKDQ